MVHCDVFNGDVGNGKVREASAAGIASFHRTIGLEFKEGTTLEVAFQDGRVKAFDMASLFGEYPQLEALRDRGLFTSGRLLGSSGIVWSDELDIDANAVYEEGRDVGAVEVPVEMAIGEAVREARVAAGLTQSQLAGAAGIDQSDLSKIERGAANPSVRTLQRLAAGMGKALEIEFVPVAPAAVVADEAFREGGGVA